MRISLNWLKKYVKVPDSVSDAELISLIGSRLVEVEGVIDETHKYDGIVVVRVEKAEKIPDTHLTLCQINDGGEELIQVVCGAPNVRAGMLAAWIKPGAIVPASVHEDAPFVIGKRKMLGKYESNGMLAGADELDFDNKHEKIAEIDPSSAKPGDLFADVFDLNDSILEIENKSLTHRPDCFGIIGFAREIAGILGTKFDVGRVLSESVFSDTGLENSKMSYTGQTTEPPATQVNLSVPSGIYVSEFSNHVMHPKKTDSATRLVIKISSPDICQRYTALVLEKHGELSKKYLTLEDTRLAKSGMNLVSPIVDVTNYLMLLTGQPLHAFDLDKFITVGGTKEVKVGVRLARAGEKLVLLDDKEVVLNENDIVITSGDTPVALAGAMGGKSTEIDEDTKNILLESAIFSLYNLRKTQMAHGIFSEAITRFTKGQPAYQTLGVAEVCAEMLASGFKVVSVADEYPNPEKPTVVKITTIEINDLLGTNYDKEVIVKTLENVGFEVASMGDGQKDALDGRSEVVCDNGRERSGSRDAHPSAELVVTAPAWRTDIHIKEDIIEEVGRLLGYDNIQPTLPLHATAERNLKFELKREVRELLSKYGANEVLTYSFVSEKLLEKVGQDKKNSYKIVNSISPELQYIRQSLIPSLLEKVYLNEKLPVERFAIFEMNKVERKDFGVNEEKAPVEGEMLGFVVAERKNQEAAFYKAKKYAAKLFSEFNISPEFLPLKRDFVTAKPFEPKRSAEILVDGICVGVIGEFKNSVRNEFKLAPYLAGFEISLDAILDYRGKRKDISFAPRKIEDLTITTTKTYAEALKEVQAKYPDAEITPGTIYRPEGVSENNITFHIEY